MANLSSSKKMVRKIIKRTERNKSLRTNVRTHIRRFEEAVASGETNEAQLASVSYTHLTLPTIYSV